jgi:predicted small metal-binding protein
VWEKGNEDEMRAMLCGCGHHLEASDYEGLVGELLDHLGLEHPEIGLCEDHVQVLRKIVLACSYRFEEMHCDRAVPEQTKRLALSLIGLAGGRT